MSGRTSRRNGVIGGPMLGRLVTRAGTLPTSTAAVDYSLSLMVVLV